MSVPDSLPAGCEPTCHGCRHRQLDVTASLAQKASYLARTLQPWLGEAELQVKLEESLQALGVLQDEAATAHAKGAWKPRERPERDRPLPPGYESGRSHQLVP